MASSEQLEREADQARAQLARLVSELRARFSLRDIFDRLADPGETGAVASISQKMRDNPLPLSLVGAGLAWMAMKGFGAGSGERLEDAGAGARPAEGVFAVSASDRSERIASFVQSEPVILAGLGVALGAMLGALLPASEKAEAIAQEGTEALRGEPPAAAGGNGAFNSPRSTADERRAI